MPSPTPPNSPPASPDPDAVMAEMMGFSSFGSKPNSKKKRKLHPTSPENTGSGSNSLPLGTGSRGKRKLELAKDKGKGGERDQGKRNEGGEEKFDQRDAEDDSVDDGGVPLKGPNQIPQPQLNQSVKDSDLILDSITKTHAKVIEEEEEEENSAKSGFEKNASRVLAEGLPLYITQAQQNPSVLPYQSPSQLLLQSSYPNPASNSQSQHGRQKHDFKSLRKGIRDERGDMAYYDGSFVEDPWRGLLT